MLLTPDAMHETSEMMFGLVDGKVEEVDPPGPLIISEIRDVDGDRTSELIGVPSESDQRSGDLCREYNPTLVYRHRNGKKPAFVLDEDLSRTANLQRGFPWAGAKYISQDEAMVIMDPDTKKRRVMGRAEAEKLGVKDCFRDP